MLGRFRRPAKRLVVECRDGRKEKEENDQYGRTQAQEPQPERHPEKVQRQEVIGQDYW
jgi:hypothetical protein